MDLWQSTLRSLLHRVGVTVRNCKYTLFVNVEKIGKFDDMNHVNPEISTYFTDFSGIRNLAFLFPRIRTDEI